MFVIPFECILQSLLPITGHRSEVRPRILRLHQLTNIRIIEFFENLSAFSLYPCLY